MDEVVAIVSLVCDLIGLKAAFKDCFKIKVWTVKSVITLGGQFSKFKKMAESRGSLLAKSVQKHAGRAKEKVSDLFPS